jgi:hypothetical protein
MKVYVNQFIQNDNYTFVFNIDPASISSDDNAAIQKYGQPVIDFGGTFTDNTSTNFIIPDNYVSLPTGFPVQVTYTITGSSVFATNTANRLQVYRTTILSNISTAITTLRSTSNADTFTGEYISNI